MQLELTDAERAALEQAARGERRVRGWRRYRAVLLAADQGPVRAAEVVGCAVSSVYAWIAQWRTDGIAGLVERPRGGGRPLRLIGAGTALLTALVEQDPQSRGWHATGWTVPLLRSELERGGYVVCERTIRRTLHRAGWRWKRPKFVLGRPDPDYAQKKSTSARVSPRS